MKHPENIQKLLQCFQLHDKQCKRKVYEKTELEEDLLGRRLGKEAKGGKKGNGKKKNKKQKKFLKIPNKNEVKIRSWGEVMLFNLKEDPEERMDLSAEQTEVVERLKARAVQHFYHLFPRQVPEEDEAGHPQHWGGYFGPGWCQVYNVKQ